jgi:hypothetical protein
LSNLELRYKLLTSEYFKAINLKTKEVTIFNNFKFMRNKLKIKSSSDISRCLLGKRKKVANHKFEYLDELNNGR